MYFFKKNLISSKDENTRAAFHWIVDILKKLNIPFQIAG